MWCGEIVLKKRSRFFFVRYEFSFLIFGEGMIFLIFDGVALFCLFLYLGSVGIWCGAIGKTWSRYFFFELGFFIFLMFGEGIFDIFDIFDGIADSIILPLFIFGIDRDMMWGVSGKKRCRNFFSRFDFLWCEDTEVWCLGIGGADYFCLFRRWCLGMIL